MKFEDIRNAMTHESTRIASNGWTDVGSDYRVSERSMSVYNTTDFFEIRFSLQFGVRYKIKYGDDVSYAKDNAARQIMKELYGDIEDKLQRLYYGVSCGEFTAQETADKLQEIIQELR